MKPEITFTLGNIREAAQAFLNTIGNQRVILFEGPMGSGKTTFISEVCRLLGADDDFGSPTFSIVNEYIDGDGNPIYHFDLYRLDTPQEFLEIGGEEYFDSGSLCMVEWPDRLGNLEPEKAVTVEINVNPDDTRTLRWKS